MKKGVHPGVGGHFEVHQVVRRESDFIHGSSALFPVDEELISGPRETTSMVMGFSSCASGLLRLQEREAVFPGQYCKEDDD